MSEERRCVAPDCDAEYGLQYCFAEDARFLKLVCDQHAIGCVCSSCVRRWAEPKKGGGFDAEYKDSIFCPYCGEEQGQEAEEGVDEWEWERRECQRCEKPFWIYKAVKVSWSAFPMEEDEEPG